MNVLQLLYLFFPVINLSSPHEQNVQHASKDQDKKQIAAVYQQHYRWNKRLSVQLAYIYKIGNIQLYFSLNAWFCLNCFIIYVLFIMHSFYSVHKLTEQ